MNNKYNLPGYKLNYQWQCKLYILQFKSWDREESKEDTERIAKIYCTSCKEKGSCTNAEVREVHKID